MLSVAVVAWTWNQFPGFLPGFLPGLSQVGAAAICGIVGILVYFAVLFLWNLVHAPARIFCEQKKEIEDFRAIAVGTSMKPDIDLGEALKIVRDARYLSDREILTQLQEAAFAGEIRVYGRLGAGLPELEVPSEKFATHAFNYRPERPARSYLTPGGRAVIGEGDFLRIRLVRAQIEAWCSE